MRRGYDFNLHGRVVLVTGAASGIGLHAVKGFLAEGAKVVMVDGDDTRLQREVEGVWRVSGRDRLLALCCDLGNDGELEDVVAQVIGHWGTVDVLVNNAGSSADGAHGRNASRRLRDIVDVKLCASLRLTQLVLPYMEKQGSGHILNAYSSASNLRETNRAADAAARAGVLVFTRALQRDYDRSRISFTAFTHSVREPFADSHRASSADTGASAVQPTPEKVAAAMVTAVERRIPWVDFSSQRRMSSILGRLGPVFAGMLDGAWARRPGRAQRS